MKHSPEEWKEIIKGKTIVQKQNRAKKCTSPIVFVPPIVFQDPKCRVNDIFATHPESHITIINYDSLKYICYFMFML
jgi:hypothetical protein